MKRSLSTPHHRPQRLREAVRRTGLTLLLLLTSTAPAAAQAPEMSVVVQGTAFSFDDCKARVSRALTAEGYGGWRDFGNGWFGFHTDHSASVGCIRGDNETVLVITTAGPGSTPARDRLRALVLGGGAGGGDTREFSPNPTINYIAWGGTRWAARLQGGGFLHAPDGDWSRAHADSIINYISWDGQQWTARLQGNGFSHAPGGDWTRAHPDSIMNYLSWENEQKTARVQQR